MAANFPNSPNNGDTFTSGALTFTFNGEAWKLDPSSGTKGEKGQKGEVGATGDKGQKGQKGEVGDKGQKGEIGASGGTGGTGQKGQKGEQGATGSAGSDGSDGDKGQKGEVGATGGGGSAGIKGQKGEKGQIGADGGSGADGSDGDKGQKGEVGAGGSGGDKGQKGEAGAAASKGQKGEVGAGGSGGDKGQKGEVGAGGSGGAKGQKGEVGAQGSGGSSGSDGAKGQKGEVGSGGSAGDKGQKGEQGSAGTLGNPAVINGTLSVGAGHPTSNFYSGADDLVVANFAQDTGISIMSGTSNEANVAFGSTTFGTGAIQARLYYDSGNDKFVMNTLTTGHDIEIKSAGTITLGDLNNPTLTIDDMTASGSNYGVEVDGTIYPKITGAQHGYRDLGLTGVRWTNVYATNLHGDGSNITGLTGIKQVQSTTNNSSSSYTVGGSSYVTLSNFSVSITPSSSASKVLVMVNIGALGIDYSRAMGASIAVNGSLISGAKGSFSASIGYPFQTYYEQSVSFSYLHSPNTTAQQTYSVQINHSHGSSRTMYFNTSDSQSRVSASTITAMEVT